MHTEDPPSVLTPLNAWRRAPLDTLERLALRGQAIVERHAFAAVAALSLLYVAWTVTLASHKQLWNDELFTYYLALLPNASLRQALLTGAEQIPPTFHLLTRGSFALFGTGQVAIRLPEIVAFLVMMLCLFRFVTVGSSPFYGLIAMVTPLVTDAYRYAYEARPSALVLCFSGLALVCWQEFAGERRPTWAIVGLTLALAAGVSSHYYGVLTCAGIGIGEVVRTWERRRLDAPVWAALGIGAAAPLLVFWPFISRSAQYAPTFFSPPTRLGQLPAFYRQLLLPGASPLGATLLLAAAYGLATSARPSSGSRPSLAWHELGAGAGFAVLPIIAFGVGKIVTHVFVNRYALVSVLGISLLPALILQRLPRGRAVLGLGYLVLVSVWFTLAQRHTLSALDDDVRSTTLAVALLRATHDDLPIVASEPHIFMTLAHYAPRDVTSRLVYLSDPAASLRHLGHNSVDRGMSELIGPWFHLPVRAYAPFVESHRSFLVYGNLGWLNWVTAQLCDDHRELELQGRVNEDYLFRVHDPDAPGERGCEISTYGAGRSGG
jgi:Dolichyl-phosphate-mannose-protein mannosyltransferase